MEGGINIKKTTHNTIFVKWDSLVIRANSCEVVSPPFTLTIDGSPISFVLSIKCYQNFIIYVHQNSSRLGRAIVLVAVKDDHEERFNGAKTSFIKKWGEKWAFSNLGILSKDSYYRVIIECKIIWLGFVDDIGSTNPPVSPSVAAPTFSDNKVFPDLKIIVEGQEIPSHKAILARHSSVFLTMFETPMKELKENKVIIEDIKCSTMEIFLKIIYTGNAEDLIDVDVILKVLHAAEKYQISTIKSLCECKLQLLIDENNVLELLEIGDKYHALELCETCIAYIMAIRNEKISMEFQRLSVEIPSIGSATAEVLRDLSSFMPIQK